MIRVRVTADPKLARAMRKLQDPALVEKMLENALVAGALQIVNAAKIRAPYKTGNLRRSIHVGGHIDASPQTQMDMADTTGTDIGGAGRYGRHQVRVRVGTNVEYAAPLEYRDAGKRAYMRPAADEAKADA
nr:HK97 gp10 family phage protein [Anaerolineae bacterium]